MLLLLLLAFAVVYFVVVIDSGNVVAVGVCSCLHMLL
jgi:hypothetical protein